MTLKAKSFEAGRISVIEEKMNKFLETIDQEAFVDMKLVMSKEPENKSPQEFFAAVIIYRE